MDAIKGLLDRFSSSERATLEALGAQKLAVGSPGFANALLKRAKLEPVEPGKILIEQGAGDNDVFFILAGSFGVEVHGRRIATRGANDAVGEMAAIVPSLPRSATVRADEPSVVARLSSADLVEFGGHFPGLWQQLAKVATQRLYQRNSLVSKIREQVAVFIISSAEALPVARAIQNNFLHDPFSVKVWPDGTFRASQYPVESLEEQLNQSDFAIAVAQGDDEMVVKDEVVVKARDNVIFELGLFLGRLGRPRTFLVEPKGGELKLPSDLKGITTLPYKQVKAAADLDAAVAPACNKLRDIFKDLGPN